MLKPESVLENETHKIICNFEIKTDHSIQARRSNPMLINKKKKKNLTSRQITARNIYFNSLLVVGNKNNDRNNNCL